MLQKAIDKIRSEMTSNNTNSYIQVVGGFLLQHLNTDPDAAEKILVADKTIGKSLEEMRKEAAKKKVGNCAVLIDQEGFDVVLKYFGIDYVLPAQCSTAPIMPAAPPAPAPDVKSKSEIDFNISLDDLLS